MSFYALMALTNTITSLFLGGFVYWKNKGSQTSKDFARFCFTATLWCLSYFFWQISRGSTGALFWCQMLTFFATFLPLTQLIFINNLLKIKQSLFFNIFIYTFSILAALLSFTPLMVAGVRPISVFKFWPQAGVLYLPYLIIWIVLILFGQYLLVKYYRKANGQLKTFLFYLIFATIVGYVGGVTNYPLWFGMKILPLGNIFVTFYVIIFAYAVSRQTILNIKIVKTEGLLFLIFAILLIDALAYNQWQQALARFILVGLFVFVAFKFVKSLLDLDKANRHLEKDKRQLIKNDKLKDEFIMMTNHELSTPITAIRGKLSMAVLENAAPIHLDDSEKEYFMSVLTAADRLNHLSRQLIDVTTIDQEKVLIYPEPTVLDDLIKEVLVSFQESANSKNDRLIYSPTHKSKPVNLDPKKIKAVLSALVENAIHFTKDGKIIIESKLDETGENVIVSVSDTGAGIEKTAQKDLFNKFIQSSRFDKNSVEQQGAGLSLYIAKNYIKLHGGKIWFESEKDKGSTFYFSLPTDIKMPEKTKETEFDTSAFTLQ